MGDMADYYLEQYLGFDEDYEDEDYFNVFIPTPATKWTTKDGREIKRSEMTNSHLEAALKMLYKRRADAGRDMWIKLMRKELEKRGR